MQYSVKRRTKMFQCFILVLFFSVVSYGQDEDGPIVEVPGGKIRGRFRENFYEFRSIPYAEPPIGEKRFEPAYPYNSRWAGIRDGSVEANACMQWDPHHLGEDLLHGEEDCLYLNVFTPATEGDDLYPVIVHIHGGAFMFGTGDMYGPEKLLKEHKFVIVNFNYRLGPLGFLSTADDVISGNMGLKDQLQAIKWVNENIRTFKGNPQNITLTGFSAGGTSVHLHILSKQSQGLFGAAISHSGTAHCSWAFIRNPLERAKKLAAHLNCPTDDTKIMKNCLQQKDAKDIVRAVKYFQPFMYNPVVVFAPVIEDTTNKNGFITEDIETIIKEGRSAKVPWIVSYTKDEGGYNAATLMNKDSNGNDIIDSFDAKWPELAPLMMFYNETVPVDKHSSYADELKKRYLQDNPMSAKTYRQVQKMFTDQIFLIGIRKSIRSHTAFTDSPVYIYQYNRPLPGGAGEMLANRTDIDFGTVHGDDVHLIYQNPFVSESKFTEKEHHMSKNLADLYESFVKTRVPKYKDIVMPNNSGFETELKVLMINDVEDYVVETVEF